MTPDLKRKRGEFSGELSGSAMAPATEAEELAALDKALTALGFTDDAKLERVLHVLTPRVVEQMASAHASTKRKAMEILSHVNKRVAAQPSMKLPLEDLMSLYVDEHKRHENSPIVKNVALVYVERAFERADAKTRAAQIARALVGVAGVRRRTARSSPAPPSPRSRFRKKSSRTKRDTHEVNAMAFLRDPEDRRAFLQHCLDYLLYQPNAAGRAPAAPAPSARRRRDARASRTSRAWSRSRRARSPTRETRLARLLRRVCPPLPWRACSALPRSRRRRANSRRRSWRCFTFSGARATRRCLRPSS